MTTTTLEERKAKSYVERHSETSAELITKILKSTTTNIGETTVFEFSQGHKVIGIFIKWFGCPVCQEVIETVGKMFPTFLKLNTVPIIFHQEDPEDAKKFFEKSKDLNVQYLPYCKTTTTLQQEIGIGSASLGAHCEAVVKANMIGLVVGKKRRSLTIPKKVSNPFSQFGVISIEEGLIKKKVVYSTLHKRMDFGLFLNDVGSNRTSLKDIKGLTAVFPKVTDSFDDDESSASLSMKSSTISKRESKFEFRKEDEGEIEKTLADEVGRYYLKAHATNEYSVENILIYEEISHFKGMPLKKNFKIEDQIEKAKDIYKNFLTKDAMFELNITTNLQEDYKQRIDKIEKQHKEKQDLSKLFDDLMKEVRTGVIADTFIRFKKSRYYEEYQKNKHGEQSITYLI
eukprot:gene9485-1691_t